jgi:hypothetical protein
MILTKKKPVTTHSPNVPATNLAALLNARGWLFNADLSPTGSPVWDYVPSMPRSESTGPEGHPTGIFIHAPEEPGFCSVEPASWSTLRNPYARTLNNVEDLIGLLPQIEHWRAPATLTHATPAELARMRATGEITTEEMLYSLSHFPYRPRHRGSFGELRLIQDVGLLTPQEFELIVKSIQQAPGTPVNDTTQE